MALSISAALLLLFIVLLLVRKAGLKSLHAVVCILLGFYLASTSVAPSIHQLSWNFASMIGNLRM